MVAYLGVKVPAFLHVRRVVRRLSVSSCMVELASTTKEVMTMPSKSNGGKRGRSAGTGRFVKQSTVRRSPKTTVNESTKKKK